MIKIIIVLLNNFLFRNLPLMQSSGSYRFIERMKYSHQRGAKIILYFSKIHFTSDVTPTMSIGYSSSLAEYFPQSPLSLNTKYSLAHILNKTVDMKLPLIISSQVISEGYFILNKRAKKNSPLKNLIKKLYIDFFSYA